MNDTPRPWDSFANRPSADRGLITRTGGGQGGTKNPGISSPAYYPATMEFAGHWWPKDAKLWPDFIASKKILATSILDFKGGSMRGFGYCGAQLRPTPDQMSIFELITQKPKAFVVDGQEVLSKRPIGNPGDTWIFERDNSVFINLWIPLESTRGDV